MAELLTTASMMQCPHGGKVQAISGNTRTRAGGVFVLRDTDTFLVAGCIKSDASGPCVRVQWIVAAARTKVVAEKVLTRDSVGLCLGGTGAPQGNVLIVQTQTRAKGM